MEEKTEEKSKKSMSFTRKIEEIVEFPDEEIVLENLDIAGNKYKLKIVNKSGRLYLDFNDRDYEIIINEEGIRFERLAYRHNHDHNDSESLQIGIDSKIMGVKEGEIMWRARFPHKREGYNHFTVDFGSVKRDY